MSHSCDTKTINLPEPTQSSEFFAK